MKTGMTRAGAVAALTAASLSCAGDGSAPGPRVLDPDGVPVPGALVTARYAGGRAVTVYADGSGVWSLPDPGTSPVVLEARGPAGEATARATWSPDASAGSDAGAVSRGTTWPDLSLAPPTPGEEPPASAFLEQLPDGETKRRFVVDCGGCHTFGSTRARKDGRERTEEEWRAALQLMVTSFGPGTGFPIISAEAEVSADARWLTASLAGAPWPDGRTASADVDPPSARAVLTEYDVPEPLDLPHDVAVDGPRLLVTGMFTHRIYLLDPATGAWTTEDIPVPGANPRAIDVDADGRWVVVLGAPQRIAVREPTGAWTEHPVGTYPHSVALDAQGRAWYNGHFSADPERVGAVDLATGAVTTFEVPGAGGESTIPYGLRVGPGDVVWGTQLRGNRLVRLDPVTGEVRTWTMPVADAGPRRPDLDPDGNVWIPEFGAGRLARFDAASERFTEWDFPVKDAGPYVARWDFGRGILWIGTAHADVVASFDPRSERFTVYPLPTRGALIRHLDVDEATGDVWFAYGASPGIPGKVLRLRP